MTDTPTVESLLAELEALGSPIFSSIAPHEDEIPDEIHAKSDRGLLKALGILDGKPSRFTVSPVEPLAGFILLTALAQEKEVVDILMEPRFNILHGQNSAPLAIISKILDILLSQGEAASYKPLRRLKLFRLSKPWDGTVPNLTRVSGVDAEASRLELTVAAWHSNLTGEYHLRLYEAIQAIKKKFDPFVLAPDAQYPNVLSVIQSSGTGKSRMAHELAGKIVTIPLNVHHSVEGEGFIYPPPDQAVSRYLTFTSINRINEARVELRHRLFIYNVVAVAAEYLHAMHSNKIYMDHEALANDWRQYLAQSDDTIDTQVTPRPTRRESMYREAITRSLEQLKRLRDEQNEERNFWTKCRTQGLQPVLDEIKRRVPSVDHYVTLLFVVDGADRLADMTVPRSWDSGTTTALDVFLSALQRFGLTNPYFVITLSTDPRTGHAQNPPPPPARSDLPFDCIAQGEYLYVPGTMTLDDAAVPTYMAQFGRPLFSQVAKSLHTNESVDGHEEWIARYALFKLTGHWSAKETTDEGPQVTRIRPSRELTLAAMAMRGLLDFDFARESARTLVKTLITKHMLLVHSIPKHRQYTQCSAASEPILAHAAAMLLNDYGKVDVPAILDAAFEEGLLEERTRVMLVGRLLLTQAYDEAHQRQGRPCMSPSPHSGINWSQKVPVLAFLDVLFAGAHHQSIHDCLPDNVGLSVGTHRLQDVFEKAYVRFTHFVHLGPADVLDSHFGAAALARGMAMQGSPSQARYDLAIPVLMRDDKIHPQDVTFILIQIRDRTTKHPVETTTHKGMTANDLPYIAIDMQLGVQHDADRRRSQEDPLTPQPVHGVATRTKMPGEHDDRRDMAAAESQARETLHETGDTQKPDDFANHRYTINAMGCSSSVYRVIPTESNATYASLVARGRSVEHESKDMLDLGRQMKPEWVRDKACFGWAKDEKLYEKL
ncbi:hypothetical protein PsYK624_103130 [Phanerochaete sordida]|uniref:Uncharacterized protein n=1 Tax=Phanerochaete sordida TaxID=48140 RepID=A0A9P3GFV9_9APHY|nr:hypothetical protein PsYK624_103130 [Phanerochaete sordida]